MKLHQKLLDREFRVTTEVNLTDHFASFERFVKSLDRGEEEDTDNLPKIQRQEDRRISKCIENNSFIKYLTQEAAQIGKIQRWVGRTDYSTSYERARRAKHPDTGKWFIERDEYRRVRDLPHQRFEQSADTSLQRSHTRWVECLLILQGEYPIRYELTGADLRSETGIWEDCSIDCYR